MQEIKKPKRILIFSLAYYPSFVSGAEAAIQEITNRIDVKDIAFEVITLAFDDVSPRIEHIGNTLVHRVGFGGARVSKMLFIILAALKARHIHKKQPVDGMWAMMTYMLMPLTIARWIGVHVPYALTLQDGDPYTKVFQRIMIRPFLPIIDTGFRHASIVQVISQYLGTWPKKRGYKGKVVLVRNGANPKNFKQFYDEEVVQEIKKELGKKDGDVYLSIAARLVPQKGIDTIIRALPLLPEYVHFLCIGGGSEQNMLADLVDELHVNNRVHFLGALKRDDVPKYRNTIVTDIFVHPSRSEGLGNSVLSAMAARIPCVTTQVGGLADFVFDAERNPNNDTTAWAVDPDSPQQIADAVLDIMGHPQRVDEVTSTARALIDAEYHWDAVAQAMRTKVFQKLFTPHV